MNQWKYMYMSKNKKPLTSIINVQGNLKYRKNICLVHWELKCFIVKVFLTVVWKVFAFFFSRYSKGWTAFLCVGNGSKLRTMTIHQHCNPFSFLCHHLSESSINVSFSPCKFCSDVCIFLLTYVNKPNFSNLLGCLSRIFPTAVVSTFQGSVIA